MSNSKKNYKKALYQGGEYAALLMVLSNAFGCLPHEIVVTNLHAYGFCKASLRLIAIWRTDIRELKSTILIALGVWLNMGCLKVQF